jgi:hypothetical protein
VHNGSPSSSELFELVEKPEGIIVTVNLDQPDTVELMPLSSKRHYERFLGGFAAVAYRMTRVPVGILVAGGTPAEH